MSALAQVEFDPRRFGIRIAVRPRKGYLIHWETPTAVEVDESLALPDEAWLRLDEDIARAMYEALAEYFGHAGHDIRTLRKDYEAERKRVDLFIAKAVQA